MTDTVALPAFLRAEAGDLLRERMSQALSDGARALTAMQRPADANPIFAPVQSDADLYADYRAMWIEMQDAYRALWGETPAMTSAEEWDNGMYMATGIRP